MCVFCSLFFHCLQKSISGRIMTRGKIILGTKTQCEMDELLWSIVWQLFLPCVARNATTYSKMAPFFSSYKNGSTKKYVVLHICWYSRTYWKWQLFIIMKMNLIFWGVFYLTGLTAQAVLEVIQNVKWVTTKTCHQNSILSSRKWGVDCYVYIMRFTYNWLYLYAVVRTFYAFSCRTSF